MVYSLFCSRGITALVALGCALLAIGGVGALPLRREAFSSFTTLSTDQITAFRPFSFYAAAAYCSPSTVLASSCGGTFEFNIGQRGRSRYLSELLCEPDIPAIGSRRKRS